MAFDAGDATPPLPLPLPLLTPAALPRAVLAGGLDSPSRGGETEAEAAEGEGEEEDEDGVGGVGREGLFVPKILARAWAYSRSRSSTVFTCFSGPPLPAPIWGLGARGSPGLRRMSLMGAPLLPAAATAVAAVTAAAATAVAAVAAAAASLFLASASTAERRVAGTAVSATRMKTVERSSFPPPPAEDEEEEEGAGGEETPLAAEVVPFCASPCPPPSAEALAWIASFSCAGVAFFNLNLADSR